MATLYDTINASEGFGIFANNLHLTSLAATLKEAGPWTVFVAPDAAFGMLEGYKREEMQQDQAKLTKIMKYHIIPGFFTTNDMLDRVFLKTLEGQRLVLDSLISAKPEREKITSGTDVYRYVIEDQITETIQQSITVNGVSIIQANFTASNGIMHAVDKILIPKFLML